METSGKTKICGIIGDPVGHSLSPIMHNAAFSELKLDFIYVAFPVKKAELHKAMTGIRCLKVHGLNVTMPHKIAVITHLDDIDPTARFIGAVNTILNKQGKLVGFNTDGMGAMNALKKNGVDLERKKVLLLGAGGAAKAVACSLIKEVGELKILNRTLRKAKQLAQYLIRASNKKIYGALLSAKTIHRALQDTDLLINATSVGMYPNTNQNLVDLRSLRSDLCVMDLVYNPVETKLILAARAKGAKVVSGIEMLIYQGAASFKIWTNTSAPINIMKQAILRKLSGQGAI
jgi:shikimate dehydrogenase